MACMHMHARPMAASNDAGVRSVMRVSGASRKASSIPHLAALAKEGALEGIWEGASAAGAAALEAR